MHLTNCSAVNSMKCCKLLVDGAMESLPFGRTIGTGFYDGPIEGFTECSACKQAYSFRTLDWDDLQDVRITAFAPLQISMDEIAIRLKLSKPAGNRVPIVPPLSGPLEMFVKGLLASHPNHVAAVSNGWPGQSSVWRNIRELDFENIRDWFSFLGIVKGGSLDTLSE